LVQFAQLVAFGGKGIITENDRAEQRKRIKYNHLVASSLIFHNAYAMTQVLHRLLYEGILVREETIRHLCPYLTEPINRFGVYEGINNEPHFHSTTTLRFCLCKRLLTKPALYESP
jgi:hypothetical protein